MAGIVLDRTMLLRLPARITWLRPGSLLNGDPVPEHTSASPNAPTLNSHITGLGKEARGPQPNQNDSEDSSSPAEDHAIALACRSAAERGLSNAKVGSGGRELGLARNLAGRRAGESRAGQRLGPIACVQGLLDPLKQPPLGVALITPKEVGIDDRAQDALFWERPPLARPQPVLSCGRILGEPC